METEEIKYLILYFLFENSPENFTPSILDLGYLKEKFNIGREFETAFDELNKQGLIENASKGWSGVFYANISKKGIDYTKILIKNGDMIKFQILMYILENDSKMRSSSSSDLQNIFEKFMEKFNITGIGVYSIIKDLMSENIVEINNNELNNESIIKIKKTN